MRYALEGIRVLDLSRVLAGPYCTMTLGDLGAEVIKVEQPGVGDDTRRWGPPWAGTESAYYLTANRNKLGITVNFKDERGKEIIRALARQSDIVVENYKVGGLDRLGLGYEDLSALNSRLIWCSITGYGLSGPDAARAGYDVIAQGESGLMSITGEPGGEPMKVGVAIVDIMTGLFASNAILAALHARETTGRGQRIDSALIATGVAALANVASSFLTSGELPQRFGNAHANLVPYQTYKARDRWMIVGAGNDRMFREICRITGLEHLAEDERFATNPARVVNREQLNAQLQAAFETRDADEWLEAMAKAAVPSGSINTLDRVFDDPQVKHRQMVVEMPHPTAETVRLLTPPFLLSETPAEVRLRPPLLGEHTDALLRNRLGYDDDTIARLRADGVI